MSVNHGGGGGVEGVGVWVGCNNDTICYMSCSVMRRCAGRYLFKRTLAIVVDYYSVNSLSGWGRKAFVCG